MVKRPVISVIKTHYKAKIINTVLLFQRFLKSHPVQMDPFNMNPYIHAIINVRDGTVDH